MSETPVQITSVQIPDNAPWYVKSALAIGHTFGVSAILLAFFLGQSAGVIPDPKNDKLAEIEDRLGKVESQLQQNAGATIQHDASVKELIKNFEQEKLDRRQDRQKWCVLKAKTDDEKRACFPSTENK